MSVTLALAGDTMLGRSVARLVGRKRLFSPEVVRLARDADAVLLNLECCVSTRGSPWQAPGKPFFFRAPPAAVGELTGLGVSCVTCANNHALDFGHPALIDTLRLLDADGIAHIGAGENLRAARAPGTLSVGGLSIGVLGFCDHPEDFAAGHDTPGVAYADTGRLPSWVTDAVRELRARHDAVLVTPHWGPNMIDSPLRSIRRAADRLIEAGATIVAGHSAHVFHGGTIRDGRAVLYDLGDFIDDYSVDPFYRNDLGLFWLVTLDSTGRVERVLAVPLRLEFCYTREANEEESRLIGDLFLERCRAVGSSVTELERRLSIQPCFT